MRFVLLHYHILKNAGMTVEHMLHENFGHRFCTFDTNDRDGCVSSRALLSLLSSNPELTAISSHQIHYPLPAITGFIFFDLCFLRDPIDRIRSTYDYFRKKPAPGDPVSEIASSLPMGDFIERLIDEMPWYVNNVQVNLLANGIVNDPPSECDLHRATDRMLQTSFLGVVDLLAPSLAVGQHFLRTVFPALDCAESVVNVSGSGGSTLQERMATVESACSARVYRELLRLNAFDFQLLESARAEVLRRHRLVWEEQDRAAVIPRKAESTPIGGPHASGSEMDEIASGYQAVARVCVQDVDVLVFFVEPNLHMETTPEQRLGRYQALQTAARNAGLTGAIVVVWKDDVGRTRFIAPAEQHPFFRIMNYDQLYAQIDKGTSIRVQYKLGSDSGSV